MTTTTATATAFSMPDPATLDANARQLCDWNGVEMDGPIVPVRAVAPGTWIMFPAAGSTGNLFSGLHYVRVDRITGDDYELRVHARHYGRDVQFVFRSSAVVMVDGPGVTVTPGESFA